MGNSKGPVRGRRLAECLPGTACAGWCSRSGSRDRRGHWDACYSPGRAVRSFSWRISVLWRF